MTSITSFSVFFLLLLCTFNVHVSATYTTNYCKLNGILTFLPPPIQSGYSCANRGAILNPNDWSFSNTELYTSSNSPLSFTANACIPDSRITLIAKSANTDSNRFKIKIGNGGWSTQYYSTANSLGNNMCPSGSDKYVQITSGIAGDGAFIPSGTTQTSIQIKVSSSNNRCVERTYYVKITNPTCTFSPSACIPDSIKLYQNTSAPLQLVSSVFGGLRVTGGSAFPLVTLGTYVSEQFIKLSFVFDETPTTVTFKHMTRPNLQANWGAETTVSGTYTYSASATITLPWTPNKINGYKISISSTSSNKGCSFINYIIQFINPAQPPPPPPVQSSTGGELPDLPSSSSVNIHPDLPSSSSVTIDDISSSTGGGGGFGDPQFTGLRGQSFQVHGYDGAVFNIITNKHFQLNALFVFLTGPRPCPVMPSGQQSAACWSHDGSYLGDIGMKTNTGDEIHIQPGHAEDGFVHVTYNNRSLSVGETVEFTYQNDDLFNEDEANSKAANKMLQIHGLNQGKITRTSTHELSIEVSCFQLEIENVDGFVNLRRLSIPNAYRTTIGVLRTHGLLGQTWQLKRYTGWIKEIEGDVDDYVVEDGIFGTDFVFNSLVTV